MINDRSSDSPILYLGISKAYLRASDILWESEFESRNRMKWDLALLFHPVSHLLGVAIETAMKGLISCRAGRVSRTHDLRKLLEMVSDPTLLASLDSELAGLSVPGELLEANPEAPVSEVEGFYRRHHFHFDMLNRLYDRPYATRYPVLGGHSLPDAVALRRMTLVLQARLAAEMTNWRPKRDSK